MGDGESNEGLKDAVLDALRGILSPSDVERNGGEQRLKALEVTDDFGSHLAEITVHGKCELAVRQLASLMLRQYVSTHWNCNADKFHSPEPSENTKAYIREILPAGLYDGESSRVRAAVAATVSAIAHWDWPDNWPPLFARLLTAVRREAPTIPAGCDAARMEAAVHGAMRVLLELARDLSDQHVASVAPVLMHECYCVFINVNSYSVRTRCRSVEIFQQCVSLIAAVAEHDRRLAVSLLAPELDRFSAALVQCLSAMANNSGGGGGGGGVMSDTVHAGEQPADCGLQMQIVKTLTVLVRCVPKHTAIYLSDILTPVWLTLTSSADLYVRSTVTDLHDVQQQQHYDSDGEVLSFETLVYSIFEFVSVLVENGKFSKAVRNGLGHLVYYIIVYAQITEQQIGMWTGDANRFVEDEEDDTFSSSVRHEARDLLAKLCDEFGVETVRAVCDAVTRHVRECSTHPPAVWWKIHEACMQAVVIVSDQLVEHLNNGQVQFDLMSFLQDIVVKDLQMDGVSPFLLGQCLVTASKFGHVLTASHSQSFVQASVNALQHSRTPVLHTAALRAICGFCETISPGQSSAASSAAAAILRPFLAPIVDALLVFAAEDTGAGDVFSLVLKTLCNVIGVDADFTVSYEEKISPVAIAIFHKHNSDPVLLSMAQELFCELSKNSGCVEPLQQRLVPTLVNILQQNANKLPAGLHAASLDVLQTVVRSSHAPLSRLLIVDAFPATVHCVMNTDDNSTMQFGGECLRAFVSVAPDQVCEFSDEQARGGGVSGLDYLVQVCTHLLSPSASEFSAAFVGRLLMVIVSRLGDRLGSNLETLLRATLSKMVSSQTTTVVQSLIMVYAHLVTVQLEPVLAFLSSVPGPSGRSALHFLLSEWCRRQKLFYGSYEIKVSVVAMCKLLQHGVSTQDARINDITVEGDELSSSCAGAGGGGGVCTRSQRARQPPQCTTVPVLVKIFKLLVNELAMAIEQDENTIDEEEDDDEDDDAEGSDEQEDSIVCDEERAAMDGSIPLSDVIVENARDGDTGVDESDAAEDPDAAADPVFHLRLRHYLTDFFTTFCRQPWFALFLPHLLPAETRLLTQLTPATATVSVATSAGAT